MSFNPDKCEYMKIALKHNTISYNYTMSNAKIKEVSTAKYLGVTINNHLTLCQSVQWLFIKQEKIMVIYQKQKKG